MTGRKCEYNTTIDRIYMEGTSAISLHQVMLSVTPNTAGCERRAFAYYFQRASLLVGGELDADFWQSTIPQICRTEPAVWDAMIAISSLTENSGLSNDHDSRYKFSIYDAKQYCNDSLTWYSRSVSAIRCGIERGSIDTFTGLITCILFICIESMLGNLEDITRLCDQGIHLILGLYDPGSKTLSATQECLLKDTIVPIFIRLSSFSPRSTWTLAMDMVKKVGYGYKLPQVFTSLRSARDSMVMLGAEILLFEQDCELFLQRSRAWFISEGMMVKHKILSTKLEKWSSAFMGLVESRLKEKKGSHSDMSMIALLRSYYEMFFVSLGVCQSPSRLTTDLYTANFQEIVNQTRVFINASFQNGRTHSPYTFEIGAGIPLWFTCLRCRNPEIRRAAVSLLRQTPAVQALSKRDDGLAIINIIMMVEENTAPLQNPELAGSQFLLAENFRGSRASGSCYHFTSPSRNPICQSDDQIPSFMSSFHKDTSNEGTAMHFIPQDARIRPHGVFRLGDIIPPELTEEDIVVSNLRAGMTYLHISRNQCHGHGATWSMVHDFIPLTPFAI